MFNRFKFIPPFLLTRISLIFYSLLFLNLPFSLFAEKETEDLALYREWVDKERKDSTYHKLYEHFMRINPDSIFKAYAMNGYETVFNDWHFYLAINTSETIPHARKLVNSYLKTHRSKELELEEKLLEIMELYYRDEKNCNVELITRKADELIKKSRKENNLHIEVRALIEMWQMNLYVLSDYEKAFVYADRLVKALDRAEPDFILRGQGYFKAGILYYQFGDYEKALTCFRKTLTDGPVSFFDETDIQARNYLASYFYSINEIDSAAYYNHSILVKQDMVKERPLHNAIAICNIGHIEKSKGKNENAIACFDAGRNVMYDSGDHAFAARIDIAKGHCYLNTGDLAKAWEMIVSAGSLHRNFGFNKTQQALYGLMSRYYAYTGEPAKVTLYQDSLLFAQKEYNNQYAAMFQVKAEQQMREHESAAGREAVKLQQNKYYLALTILFSVVLLLLTFVFFYLRTKRAYRELVRKNREWALSASGEINDAANTIDEQTRTVQPAESELMNRVFQYVVTEKNYRNPGLTLNMLTTELSVNRTYLSQAINRVTGKTFIEWLNEYRIKEAIRLLSTPESEHYSFEGIALDTGFNSRVSFYRAFKKITGLSPSAYVQNSKTHKIAD